jgi:hypothetical protein
MLGKLDQDVEVTVKVSARKVSAHDAPHLT